MNMTNEGDKSLLIYMVRWEKCTAISQTPYTDSITDQQYLQVK